MNAYSDEKGFTLIELMICITVVGILSSIALQQFSDYQVRSFDARAEQDLRSAVAAQEAYYADNELYVDCANRDCQAVLSGFIISDGTLLTLEANGDGTSFQAVASHPKGRSTFNFDSATSGIITAS